MQNARKIIAPKTASLIHKALNEKGLSPLDLALRMGNAPYHISLVVSGEKIASKVMMQAIAATLKTDEAALMGAWAEDKRVVEAEREANLREEQ
jgi:hypothetical protein